MEQTPKILSAKENGMEKLEKADKSMRVLGAIIRGEQNATREVLGEIVDGWEDLTEKVQTATLDACPEIKQIVAQNKLKELFNKDFPRYATGEFK